MYISSTFAITVCAMSSGGHFNPAVTISFAVWRGTVVTCPYVSSSSAQRQSHRRFPLAKGATIYSRPNLRRLHGELHRLWAIPSLYLGTLRYITPSKPASDYSSLFTGTRATVQSDGPRIHHLHPSRNCWHLRDLCQRRRATQVDLHERVLCCKHIIPRHQD